MGLTFNEYRKLKDVDLSDLEAIRATLDCSKVEAIQIRKKAVTSLENISNRHSPNLKRLKKEYRYYDNHDKLTFAQFISIESTLEASRHIEDSIVLVVSEVLRPLSEEVYSNDNEERNRIHREAISNLLAEDVYYIFIEVINRRNDFHYKKYKNVFVVEKETDEEDTSEDPKHPQESNFYKNWHWYTYIRELAQEDIRRYEEILLMPMDMIAPEISYRQGLAKLQKQEMAEREAISKAKLRR